jgi:hypothetical protein
MAGTQNTIKNLPAVAASGLSGSDALEIEGDASRSMTLATLIVFLQQNWDIQVEAEGSNKIQDLSKILQALDPTGTGFQAAFTALFKAWAANLPVYSGAGPAPVAAGEPFMNGGNVQIAQ